MIMKISNFTHNYAEYFTTDGVYNAVLCILLDLWFDASTNFHIEKENKGTDLNVEIHFT